MARTTQGRLFTKGKKKRYYIQYYIKGKQFVRALKDEKGRPITNIKKAEKARDRVLAPYRAKDEVQRQEQAVAALRAAQDVAEKLESDAKRIELSKCWDEYVNSVHGPDCGERALKDYQGFWNMFSNWLEESAPNAKFLSDVTPETVEEYFGPFGQSRSPNTYNKHLNFFTRFFAALCPDKPNPFAGIKRKRLRTNSRRELTIDELRLVLEKADGNMALLLGIGTFTGLRLGDCCTLLWGEVDLSRRVIRRVPNKVRGRQDIPKPVVIGIPDVLRTRLEETPLEGRIGYVIPSYAERYLNEGLRSDITKEIQAHFEACGIRTHREGTGYTEKDGKRVHTGKRAIVEVGFHSLQHTYVSPHAERGTPQAVIQANVGHSSPAMTRHYTHISEGVARDVAKRIALIGIDETQPARSRLRELSDTLPLEVVEKLVECGERYCAGVE